MTRRRRRPKRRKPRPRVRWNQDNVRLLILMLSGLIAAILAAQCGIQVPPPQPK